MNKEIAAYAAGIFDGEGYVDIYQATKSAQSKNVSLMLRVVISQKDGRLMEWLKTNFGGYVSSSRKDKYQIYRWDIRSRQARDFIDIIYPYTLIKRDQLDLAKKFDNVKGNYLNTLKGKRGFRTLTEEEIKERLLIKEELKRLKRVYLPYKKNGAPTTTE